MYLCLSSSSDDHLLSHSVLGTGTRFGSQNKFCHYRASLVHSVSLTVSSSLLVCWWEQYHDTATSGTDYLDLHNLDKSLFICVLVNTLQYHDTVDLVQDSETEDPQLVAEPGVGRNHGETMGKSR